MIVLVWIMGVAILVMLVAILVGLKLLTIASRDAQANYSMFMDAEKQRDDMASQLMAVRRYSGNIEAELKAVKDQLQEAKCGLGLIKKNLKATVEYLRGRNFRSKKEALEHSKPFKQFCKTLDSL